MSTYPCEHAEAFQRNIFGRLEFDSLIREAPLVLPAILNPFIEGAPAAVMTRIALDWIVDRTPLDALFEDVAENQYAREFRDFSLNATVESAIRRRFGLES